MRLTGWTGVALALGSAGLAACGGQQIDQEPERAAALDPSVSAGPTPSFAPRSLSEVLEGPVADLEAAVRRRVKPLPEACLEGEAPPPPRPSVTFAARVEGRSPLLEAASVRYPGDVACSPIEYCALALRSASGWWLTPHDENVWCEGVTGPSNRIELEDEELETSAEPGLLIHRGVRVIHTRDHGLAVAGREESWSTSRTGFERRCEITPDARAHCQR